MRTALHAALRAAGTAGEVAVCPVGLLADEIPGQRTALREVEHRPWPLPARPWLMGQTWYSLLFAHWALPPEMLRPLIPAALELHVARGRPGSG